MSDVMTQNLQALARVRREYEAARQAYQSKLADFESSPDMIALSLRVDALAAEQETLDANIRRDAETCLMQTGETGHPALKTRTTTDVAIDEVKALAWCHRFMPVAVQETLDRKMLTDYARKHEPDWACVTKKQQITIARDLAPFFENQPEADR